MRARSSPVNLLVGVVVGLVVRGLLLDLRLEPLHLPDPFPHEIGVPRGTDGKRDERA